eukprot:TRINITY_DN95543_c0_g1_i1.p1 TRINITY_DN95543_c0_g1~~TRINITY_DN95543_c0_g1_i1.p1  ORF type:complete len:290 (-),score=23.70 TRINITY_DN95543_c0_g1_i1:67-936(-)
MDHIVKRNVYSGSAHPLPYVGAYLVRRTLQPRSIFMTIPLVPYFLRNVIGETRTQGVVVYLGRGWEDAFVPSRWLKALINHPKVIHAFVENPTIRHAKVTAMPIGMDASFLADESGRALAEIANSVSLEDKIVDRVAGSWGDFGPIRVNATKWMMSTPWCDWISTDGDYGVRQIEYWKKVSKYAFHLSPPASYRGQGPRGPMGAGDSYRTFEALVLRSIPILWVGQSALAWEGDDIPVVIVSDWSHVTPSNLTLWWDEKKHLLQGERPYLRSTYWWEKIESVLNASRGM